MYLTHLSLTNFRTYARLDIDIPRGPVILVGGNAQGKTSLLEAIYYLATIYSFQATNDRQLVSFMAKYEPYAVAKVIADFTCYTHAHQTGIANSSTQHRLEVRLILEPGEFNGTPRLRKEALLDGSKQKISSVVGKLNAVLFLPQMLRIIEGSPEERRRYLNLILVQVSPHYADLLTDYSRVISQRNALLKQLAERGGDAQQLTYWDELLASLGAQLIHSRIHAIHALERLANTIHRDLTRNQEVLRLDYQPAYDPLRGMPGQYEFPFNDPIDRSGLSLETIQNGFMECLERIQVEEIARGVTTIGPHRDELRFMSNQIDLGTFGSRGQARTAMLSMKLAEIDWMKEKSGQWPVLLLDEVLAELDPERRIDLLRRISESEQPLLTTTDLDLFGRDFIKKTTLWQVRGGRIIRQ